MVQRSQKTQNRRPYRAPSARAERLVSTVLGATTLLCPDGSSCTLPQVCKCSNGGTKVNCHCQ